jgi:enediyne biosynthesis protein E4
MAQRGVPHCRKRGWRSATVGVVAVLGVAGGSVFSQEQPDAFVVVNSRDTGIDFVHRNGGTGAKEMIETMGSGCAIADFDNDGLPDIFFVNGAAVPSLKKDNAAFSNRLYRNLGNFHFVDVTDKAGLAGSGYGMGVAVGDYNNDGFEDIYVTGFEHNQLFRNRGNGTFEDVTAKAGVAGGGWSTSAAFVDYDRDGLLDLVVARYVQYTIGTGPYCGDKARGWSSYCLPDQFLPSSLLLYHNNGNGTFSDVTDQAGLGGIKVNALGIRIVDLDGDGWPDIVVASDRTRNLLFHNREGRFEEIGTTAGVGYSNDGVARAGMGIDAADVNGEGRPDIAITNFESEGTALFMNQGGLSFRDEAGLRGLLEPTFPFVGFGLRLFDFDNDGFPDLMVTSGHVLDDIARYRHDMTWPQPVLLLHNNDGRFVPVPVHGPDGQPLKLVGRGLATGDLTNSGRLDAVISQNDGPPVLLRNEAGRDKNSISLRLIGARSNRDGFGTRVEAKVDGRVWISEVTPSGSYMSSSDPRVVIGMGTASQVQTLKLSWPSGTRQELRALAAGYIYTIREQQGLSRPESAKKFGP